MSVPELQFGNIGTNFLNAYRQGQQRARGEQFNRLAGQAAQASPAQRDALIAQAVELDPSAGLRLGEELQVSEDRRRTQLYNMARGFKTIHGSNPAAAASYYQTQLVPGLQRLGFEVPAQYDEASVLSVVDQVLAGGSGTPAGAKQAEFEYITQGFSPENLQLAREIEAGIKPRAVTGAVKNITVRGLDGKERQGYFDPNTRQTFVLDETVNQFRPLGAGEMISVDRTQPTPGPQPADGGGVFASLYSAVPGLRVTSGARTPEQNAAVGGVPNSFHLTGQAIDVGRPSPEQRRRIDAWAMLNNFEVIDNYGDGHIHLEPRGNVPAAPKSAMAPAPASLGIGREATPQGYVRDSGGNLVQEQGGPAQVASQEKLLDNERAQRQETSRLVEEPQKVLSAYEKVRSAAQSSTGASDMSLIFGYMKMLDPGSVVREGEFANASNTGGLDDKLIGLYNKARGGNFLSQEQKANFVSQANQIAEGARSRITSVVRNQQEIARQSGLDPFRATGFADFSGVESRAETTQTPRQAPSVRGPARPQTEAEYDALPSGALFIDPDDGKTYRKD